MRARERTGSGSRIEIPGIMVSRLMIYGLKLNDGGTGT
jgi:hypothetical protein